MSIPIPHRPSGFILGDPGAENTIDAFLDIQCPHSRAMWPTLLELLNRYEDKSLNLKVHLITLSNHRQAWDLSLGIFALAGGDASKFYDFTSFVYERQEEFYNAAFLNKSHYDLQQSVIDLAESHSQVDRIGFYEKMTNNSTYIQARTPIRYAATKAVWATPTIFINNGNDVPVNHKSTLADWQQVIDSLLDS